MPCSDWGNGLNLNTSSYSPNDIASDSVTSSPYMEVNNQFSYSDPSLQFFTTWDGGMNREAAGSSTSSSVMSADRGAAIEDQDAVSSWLANNAINCEGQLTDEPVFDKIQPSPNTPESPLDQETCTPPLWWQRNQLSKHSAQSSLKAADISQLRSIAMPSQPHPISPVSSPEPESQDNQKHRKRKASESSDSEPPEKKHQPHRKQAHNMIEKRYRANLNDKILALRDSIPTLRTAAQGMSFEDDAEEEQGSIGIRKLNKVCRLFFSRALSFSYRYHNHYQVTNST